MIVLPPSPAPEFRPGDIVRAVTCYRLRPAAPPAEEKPECYGSRPDPLPETLPKGTRWRLREHGNAAEFGAVSLRSGDQYWGNWSDPIKESYVPAGLIDWTTVPKQPPSAESVEKYEGSSLMNMHGPSSYPAPPPIAKDAWGIVRAKEPAPFDLNTERWVPFLVDQGIAASRVLALTASDHPLDRLAARRARHQRAALLDRPSSKWAAWVSTRWAK